MYGASNALGEVLALHFHADALLVRTLLDSAGIEPAQRVQLLDPLGYRDMIQLVKGAMAVLTDSSGLQETTTALGHLRENTERPITVPQERIG